MNMFLNRETLLAGAGYIDGDLLTCALQLMMTALTIVDTAQVPSDVGAHLDHAMQKLADYMVGQQSAAKTPS